MLPTYSLRPIRGLLPCRPVRSRLAPANPSQRRSSEAGRPTSCGLLGARWGLSERVRNCSLRPAYSLTVQNAKPRSGHSPPPAAVSLPRNGRFAHRDTARRAGRPPACRARQSAPRAGNRGSGTGCLPRSRGASNPAGAGGRAARCCCRSCPPSPAIGRPPRRGRRQRRRPFPGCRCPMKRYSRGATSMAHVVAPDRRAPSG